uniref:Uncharacterized protein n=1 Tax=Esox lucius TaxID=8010 RepID=A0A3P8Z9E3_ESOLU
MPVVQNINSLEDLRVSGFGRPRPRHGLQLLFWFAKNCVHFDNHNNMRVRCDPRRCEFGFHYFSNFEDILPALVYGGRQKYFEVGNLNTEMYPGADDLPLFVTERYNLHNPQSNKDRVIICLDQSYVTATYVSVHTEGDIRGSFDCVHTYRVSPGLIKIIQSSDLDLQMFLDRMGRQREHPSYVLQLQSKSHTDFNFCTFWEVPIIVLFLCILCILVAVKLQK